MTCFKLERQMQSKIASMFSQSIKKKNREVKSHAWDDKKIVEVKGQKIFF